MAYIGLALEDHDSRNLLGAKHWAQLHLTLVHFEKPAYVLSLALAADLERLAETTSYLKLYPDAVRHFDVGDVLTMKMTNGLMTLRSSCCGLLMKHGISWSRDHKFLPHVTLGVADTRVAELIAKGTYLYVDKLELCGTRVHTRYLWKLDG